MTDAELLAEYCQSRSDAAFAAIVERYVRLVHTACWRQLRDAQLAEDATQQVFVLLSQKAGRLRHDPLAGWLLTTARFTCANTRRAEQRRQANQESLAMAAPHQSTGENSEMLEMLDEGMLRLRSIDREAIALRYLQGQPLREVGEALGLSEDAARKRVDRGLEKLRRFFQNRGMTTNCAALAAVLAGTSNAPPVGESLTGRIVAAAARGAKSPMILARPLAAMASVVIVTATLALAGWAIFTASAPQPGAQATSSPPVQSSPAPPTAANANPPTVVDFSTPDATFASLSLALQKADSTAAYACLLADPNKPKTPMLGCIDEELARNRMVLAGVQKYGPAGMNLVSSRQGERVAPILQAIVVVRQLSGDGATISGDSATIALHFPNALLRSVSGNVREALLGLSGKCIYFERADNGWRIDLDRTVRCDLVVFLPGKSTPHDPGEARAVAILDALADEYNSVAAEIDAGKLPRLSDAQRAADATIGRVCEKFNIDGINSGCVAADVRKP